MKMNSVELVGTLCGAGTSTATLNAVRDDTKVLLLFYHIRRDMLYLVNYMRSSYSGTSWVNSLK